MGRLTDKHILGGLMNCTCIDLNGKYFYDTGVIYRKRITGMERIEKVEVRLLAA